MKSEDHGDCFIMEKDFTDGIVNLSRAQILPPQAGLQVVLPRVMTQTVYMSIRRVYLIPHKVTVFLKSFIIK